MQLPPVKSPQSHGQRAPDVVVVLFDDMGYSDLGCYGSTLRTPTIDQLAEQGLRYTQFDVTPLCSPTRASLLTGRNPHAVGMGTIVQFASGEPGYTGRVPPTAAMLPAMLKPAGYGCGLFGKWHLSPNAASGPGGPYDEWPLARGFDRFFGFLSGRVHQFRPELVQDNSFVDAASYGGRHVSELIVDEAIRWTGDHVYARPEDPYFAMISFGAVHSPHHAPPAYVESYRGAFSHGWDEERRCRFARQKELGVIPAHTALPEPDPSIPAWTDLSSQERKVAERLMEAYAAHLEHADAELGRLLAALEAAEPGRERLVIVMSDNGATNAGGHCGTLSEEAVLNDAPGGALPVDLGAIGSGDFYNQYPAGWGQVSNTPFRRYKHTVHNGGTRSPLIVSGPATRRTGAIDHTRAFVTDIVPTVLELAGVEAPETVHGIAQQPLHGRSLTGTFGEEEQLGPRSAQYFEVAGHRAMVVGRWKAVTFHQPGADFAEDRWELYDLADDPAETVDLAAAHPHKLTELQRLWDQHATANSVFPLAERGKSQLFTENPDRTRWMLLPTMTPAPQASAPEISGHDFSLTAKVAEMQTGDEGVLIAMGDSFGGVSLHVLNGQLRFALNALGTITTTELPPGEHLGETAVIASVVLAEDGGASLHLECGNAIRTAHAAWVPRLRFFMGTAQCGRDQSHPVVPDYDGPFPYSGSIVRAIVEVHPRDEPQERREALLAQMMQE